MSREHAAGARAATQIASGDSALARVVGFWGLAAAIINLTIGGSIFAMPGALAVFIGPAAPLAFAAGALLFAPIVLCLSAAGSRVTSTGGPYSYVEAAFGRLPGLVIAVILWLSSVAGSGSMSSALIDQASQLVPSLADASTRTLALICVYFVLALVNASGVRAGAAANIVFAAAKVVPLVLVAVIGGRYVHVENVRVANFPDWSSVGTSLVLVVFAYSGIETALAPSGEITNSERVIPKAALAGVGVVVLLYVGLQFVAQGILGPALRGHEAPLAAVGGMLLPGGRGLLIFTACVSLIGCIQGDLLGTSRLLYAVARDGFLPRQLAVVNARHRVPVRAVAAHACTACVLAIAGSFTTLALVSGGAFCFVYIACCASAWKLQRNGESDTGSPLILPGGPTIPALAVIGLLLLLASLSSAEWTAIGLAAVASCGLYGLRAHRLHRSA